MTNPCRCGRRAVPDRTYRAPRGPARRQCRRCRRLIDPHHQRSLPKTEGRPYPQERATPDRGAVLTIAANLFRAMPHLRNADVYDRLREEGMELPAYATWMSRYAPEARKMSGTKPVRGRPSSDGGQDP